jgi:hypothetical protein
MIESCNIFMTRSMLTILDNLLEFQMTFKSNVRISKIHEKKIFPIVPGIDLGVFIEKFVPSKHRPT